MRSGLRRAVEPTLERSMVRQDQVGLGAGLVDKATEAHDGRNFGQSFSNAKAWWGGENGIGLIQQQQLGRLPRQSRMRERVQAGKAGLRRGGGLKNGGKDEDRQLITAAN